MEMVSLAAHVASWNQKPGAERGLAAFEAVEHKILEKAKHAGLGEQIEFDQDKQRYQMKVDEKTGAFFQECYDEFRNENFWEELVIRMADRDLARQIGKQAWEKLTEEERREKTSSIEKTYWKEFSEKGIDHVAVIFPHGEG